MSSSHNQIWLSIDNDDGSIKEGFQLPYNPESYRFTKGTNEKVVNIAGLGQTIVKSGRSPATLVFESFFTLTPDTGIELDNPEDMKTPMEYDSLLNKWKDGDDPIHVVITNTNINAYFSISTYVSEEEGGDIGKINYALTLKQYGSSGDSSGSSDGYGTGGLIRRIDIEPYELPTVPAVYTVQKKDTLQSIAKYYYNDLQKVYDIYYLNSALLKQGVNTKLKANWVLNMPQ